MSDSKFISVFVFCFIGLCGYQCLKLIPERASMQYYDKQYYEYGSINVRRARRGGDYIVNVNFTLLQYLGNNVTVFINFYEYLNNQYKPSFVQLHYKLCDLILKDKFIGQILRRGGCDTCPIYGIYTMKNLYFNEEIPSLWPFEKGMFEVVLKHNAKPDDIIVKVEVMFSFTHNVPQKRNKTKASKSRAGSM